MIFILCHSCTPQIGYRIILTNQLERPIEVEYYAFNSKYFFEIDKVHSKKDKHAKLLYNPLLCKNCVVLHDSNNKVTIIVPPKDSVAISGSKIGVHYPGDEMIIGELKISRTQTETSYPSGFEVLNHLHPFGDYYFLSIDSTNIELIEKPDSFNFPCMIIEKDISDSKNMLFDHYIFCKLPDDTIKVVSYSRYMIRNILPSGEYHEYYYKNQRDGHSFMGEVQKLPYIPIRPKK